MPSCASHQGRYGCTEGNTRSASRESATVHRLPQDCFQPALHRGVHYTGLRRNLHYNIAPPWIQGGTSAWLPDCKLIFLTPPALERSAREQNLPAAHLAYRVGAAGPPVPGQSARGRPGGILAMDCEGFDGRGSPPRSLPGGPAGVLGPGLQGYTAPFPTGPSLVLQRAVAELGRHSSAGLASMCPLGARGRPRTTPACSSHGPVGRLPGAAPRPRRPSSTALLSGPPDRARWPRISSLLSPHGRGVPLLPSGAGRAAGRSGGGSVFFLPMSCALLLHLHDQNRWSPLSSSSTMRAPSGKMSAGPGWASPTPLFPTHRWTTCCPGCWNSPQPFSRSMRGLPSASRRWSVPLVLQVLALPGRGGTAPGRRPGRSPPAFPLQIAAGPGGYIPSASSPVGRLSVRNGGPWPDRPSPWTPFS